MGESFSYTANAMPEPVKLSPDGFPMTFPDVFAGQVDQDRQERAAQEAKQRAVELMRHYSNVADAAVISVGTFVPPQSVVVHVPPPDNTIGRPIEHGGGSIEGPTGEPRRPGGPSSPLDAGSPRDGSPNPNPVPNASPVTADGGQTTTPGFADPVERPPVGPTRGPGDGPPVPSPVPGFDPITGRRLDPVSGRPVDVNTGRPVGGPGGRGTAGGPPAAGSPGEPGRGRSADDGHRPGRGALTGSGPMEAERAAPGRGGAAAARAGLSGGPAMAPAGAGARREEDQERRSPEYLRDYHDEFWDDGPAVAPPVLGAEEDAPPAQPST